MASVFGCYAWTARAHPGALIRRAGATFTVNSTTDAVDAAPGNGLCDAAPPSGQCTLRAAIQEANALVGADTVILPAGMITLTLAGAGEDAAASGDLDLTSDVTLQGAGQAATVVNGNQLDTVFQVLNGATLSIEGLTVRGGRGTGAAGGIRNAGALSIDSATVSNNSATAGGSGGGIDNAGELTIQAALISQNTASGRGGGIHNTGTVTVTGATIGANTAGSDGGGLAVAGGAATITSGTLENNQSAGTGGGAWNNAGLALRNVTVSLNRSDLGGAGIAQHAAAGVAALANVTVANNISRGPGGGLRVDGLAARLQNTLIGGNLFDDGQGMLTASDCSGAVDSHGHNLIAAAAGCALRGSTTGNLLGVDPGIAALFNNGGSTRTHALQPGSPALEAGDPALPGSGGDACEATDQRGIPRPQVYRCDIGAFELVGDPVTATPAPSATSTSPTPGTAGPTATPTAAGTATLPGPDTPTPTAGPSPTPSSGPSPSTTATPTPTVRLTPTEPVELTPTPPTPGSATATRTTQTATRPPATATRTATRTPTRRPTRVRIYAPIVSKQHLMR